MTQKTWPGWGGPSVLRGAVRVALTLGVTWLILRGMGFHLDLAMDMDLSYLSIDPSWLVLSVFWLTAGSCGASLLWAGLLREMGGPRVTLSRALGLLLLSNLGRYVPGKVWQLVGLAFLTARTGVPPKAAGMAAIAGQVFHLLGAAIVGGLLVVRMAEVPLPWAVVVFLGSILVFSAIYGSTRFQRAVTRVVGKELVVEGHGLGRGGLSAIRWLLLYATNWVVFGVAFHAMTRGVGLPVPLDVAVPAFSAGYLVGYVAFFAPAGILVRESFLALVLEPVLGTGAAIAVAAGQRIWITFVEGISALIAAMLMKPWKDTAVHTKPDSDDAS